MGHMVTRCNKRNGQTMQIERNTASEMDLEQVHNLRLCMSCFRALFLAIGTPPAPQRRFARGFDERATSSTACALHLFNGPHKYKPTTSCASHTRKLRFSHSYFTHQPKRTCIIKANTIGSVHARAGPSMLGTTWQVAVPVVVAQLVFLLQLCMTA